MSYRSERAKKNMTSQMQYQLDFLEKNLHKKSKRMEKTKRLRIYKLPGLKWTLRRQERGIRVISSDLANIKQTIIKMQKEDKINKIL